MKRRSFFGVFMAFLMPWRKAEADKLDVVCGGTHEGKSWIVLRDRKIIEDPEIAEQFIQNLRVEQVCAMWEVSDGKKIQSRRFRMRGYNDMHYPVWVYRVQPIPVEWPRLNLRNLGLTETDIKRMANHPGWYIPDYHVMALPENPRA